MLLLRLNCYCNLYQCPMPGWTHGLYWRCERTDTNK